MIELSGQEAPKNDFPRLNALHAEPSSPEVETPYAG